MQTPGRDFNHQSGHNFSGESGRLCVTRTHRFIWTQLSVSCMISSFMSFARLVSGCTVAQRFSSVFMNWPENLGSDSAIMWTQAQGLELIFIVEIVLWPLVSSCELLNGLMLFLLWWYNDTRKENLSVWCTRLRLSLPTETVVVQLSAVIHLSLRSSSQ